MEKSRLLGCLWGMAVGDALGLRWENLSARRIQKFGSAVEKMRFLGPYGMLSDDTEHGCMTLQALAASGGVPEAFEEELVRELKRWFLGLPAGIGWATLRSLLKLCLGFRPPHSAVWSAGNAPAVRSIPLGVVYAHHPSLCRELVQRSTFITHRDPKALNGALATALLASCASQNALPPSEYLTTLEQWLPQREGEFFALIEQAVQSAQKGESPLEFVQKMGWKKVTGYMYHTVPLVVQTVFRHPHQYEKGILSLLRCGGDTDSTAAIYGGIVGTQVGLEGIPRQWRQSLWDWPRTSTWLESLVHKAALVVNQKSDPQRLTLPLWSVWLRNGLFTLTVLFWGLRRLFPPY